MRVLMLGWEYPPFVSGGVGTACQGLTRALVRAGDDILFFVPKGEESEASSHMNLVGVGDEGQPVVTDRGMVTEQPSCPQNGNGHRVHSKASIQGGEVPSGEKAVSEQCGACDPAKPTVTPALEKAQSMKEAGQNVPMRKSPLGPHIEMIEIDACLRPYARPETLVRFCGVGEMPQLGQMPPAWCGRRDSAAPAQQTHRSDNDARTTNSQSVPHDTEHRHETQNHNSGGNGRGHIKETGPGVNTSGDLFSEVYRFAHLATQAAVGKQFDVIHAHDWMTFPAAVAIAEMSGAPLVVQVHSTEFDRAGSGVDQRIYDIERMGMERARVVIAVSYVTQSLVTERYGIPSERVSVVYNAVESETNGRRKPPRPRPISRDEKIVLFLGRITMQKGPEYFLAAARKVLGVYANVRFIMAGSGDMIRQTMQLADDMGIGDKVLFTGFLHGSDVERVFRSADLYVMPSVSDPFGIASLEAISFDVPVLMSKQAGASEVLRHVLKVDFWDIDEMANKIVAVLRHPPLQATLKAQAGFEVRRLTWDEAAKRCREVYSGIIREDKANKAKLRSKDSARGVVPSFGAESHKG